MSISPQTGMLIILASRRETCWHIDLNWHTVSDSVGVHAQQESGIQEEEQISLAARITNIASSVGQALQLGQITQQGSRPRSTSVEPRAQQGRNSREEKDPRASRGFSSAANSPRKMPRGPHSNLNSASRGPVSAQIPQAPVRSDSALRIPTGDIRTNGARTPTTDLKDFWKLPEPWHNADRDGQR